VELQVEDLAEGDESGEPRIERGPRPGLALLELLVGVRRDAREVGGPLLTEPLPLSSALQADPDLTPEVFPGRYPSSYGHGPIVTPPRTGMPIFVW
jgi:hypothetical protein